MRGTSGDRIGISLQFAAKSWPRRAAESWSIRWDSAEIAAAIEFLLMHPEEGEEMGRRGSQAILERYNWANEEKTLLQFYRELFRSDDAYQKSLVGRGQTA